MTHTKALFTIFIVLSVIVAGCGTSGPVEIHYGQDQCDYCNMNIVDNSFGTQLVTAKGKAYKFDSIECLAAFQITSEANIINGSITWVTDFGNAGSFIRSDSAIIVLSEHLNSPMGIGLLGFSTSGDADRIIAENGGKSMNWEEVRNHVNNRWKL